MARPGIEPGPLTYESGAVSTVLCGPAFCFEYACLEDMITEWKAYAYLLHLLGEEFCAVVTYNRAPDKRGY